MINRNKLIESLEAMRPKPLLEETFSKLYKLSDTARIERSKPMIAYYTGLDQDKKDGQAITKWNVPSATDKNRSYTCMIALVVKGGLFSLAKEKWNAKRFAETFATADVKVHCSCPDFYWSGMKYNLGSKGNLKGHALPISSGYKHEKDDVTYQPNKRDPHRQHVLCKHLLTVVSKMHANAFTIMKDAKSRDASPVDISNTTQVEKNKKVGATKLVNETKQEQVRKSITENFAQSVINLHESGKLDDKAVDPKDIIPQQPDPDNTGITDDVVDDVAGESNSELVDISNVDMSDTDIGAIVGTDANAADTNNDDTTETTKPSDIATTGKTDTPAQPILSKDNVDKKVNPSEIIGQ